jgi:hypothetical protein
MHGRYFSAQLPSDNNISFSSINEARDIFDYAYYLFTSNRIAQPSSQSAPFLTDIEGHMGYFATLFSKFLSALQQYLGLNNSTLTPKEEISIAVLQLHVLSNYISFYVEDLPLEYRLPWDRFIPQMEEIVVLGERVLSYMSSHTVFETHTSFSLELGVIIPLYTVASLCQDCVIRRNAIALLRSTSRQEGLWNSILVAKAAERIMEIEENEIGEFYQFPGCSTRAWRANLRPVLELDGRGGRLKYLLEGQGVTTQVHLIEEMFSWQP